MMLRTTKAMRNRRVRGCAELVQVGETLLGACYSVRVMIENLRAYRLFIVVLLL